MVQRSVTRGGGASTIRADPHRASRSSRETQEARRASATEGQPPCASTETDCQSFHVARRDS